VYSTDNFIEVEEKRTDFAERRKYQAIRNIYSSTKGIRQGPDVIISSHKK
jgi:hypothetical protein